MIRIGIVGKTNTGKTTFFNAATSSTAEVSTYPFTTKKPNVGTGQVQTLCVCRELDVKDKPRNSTCIDGWRFIPIEVIDLPGLIKGAFAGRGLGTQFLNVVAQADALLHVVDASASIDSEGKITHPGMGNPILDIVDIEEEMILWFKVAVDRALQRIKKRTFKPGSLSKGMSKELAGIGVRAEHAIKTLERTGLAEKHPREWKDEDSRRFSETLRTVSKPTLIVADKRGNVIPDVYLTPKGHVAKDLAREIHSDLAKRMLHAIDARNGLRLPQDYQLRDRDIISIVTAARKK